MYITSIDGLGKVNEKCKAARIGTGGLSPFLKGDISDLSRTATLSPFGLTSCY